MATRALICFAKREDKVSFSDFQLYDDCGRSRVTHQIYHHYDGSPGFLGVKLAEFINNLGKDHNGLDCFAAQLLVHLKLGIHYGGFDNVSHNVYLETPGVEHGDLDYTYYLWSHLSIGQVRDLIYFTDYSLSSLSSYDWSYGEKFIGVQLQNES